MEGSRSRFYFAMYNVIQVSLETCMQSVYIYKVVLDTYAQFNHSSSCYWFKNRMLLSIHVYLMAGFDELSFLCTVAICV